MCNPLLGLRLLPSPFSSVTAACLLISTAVMLALRRLRVLPPVVDPEMLLRLPGDAAAPTATDEAAGWMVCRLFTVDPGDVGLSTLRWLLVRAVVVDAGIPAATPDIAAAIPFPSRFFGVNRRARHPHRTAPPHRTRGCPGGWDTVCRRQMEGACLSYAVVTKLTATTTTTATTRKGRGASNPSPPPSSLIDHNKGMR